MWLKRITNIRIDFVNNKKAHFRRRKSRITSWQNHLNNWYQMSLRWCSNFTKNTRFFLHFSTNNAFKKKSFILFTDHLWLYLLTKRPFSEKRLTHWCGRRVAAERRSKVIYTHANINNSTLSSSIWGSACFTKVSRAEFKTTLTFNSRHFRVINTYRCEC